MKKMIIFAGAMLLLAAGTVGFFANRPMSAQEALILRNVAAIAQNEQQSNDAECDYNKEETCIVNIGVGEGPDGGGTLTINIPERIKRQ